MHKDTIKKIKEVLLSLGGEPKEREHSYIAKS